jgi:hypothetical protein
LLTPFPSLLRNLNWYLMNFIYGFGIVFYSPSLGWGIKCMILDLSRAIPFMLWTWGKKRTRRQRFPASTTSTPFRNAHSQAPL